VKSIDNLIDTLETLSGALWARDKDKALDAITLFLQEFTITFEHATHIFLAIVFIETLRVHILSEEFEEASGGALALLTRLRAVNTAIKQCTDQSAGPWAEEVPDDWMDAEIAWGSAHPQAEDVEREDGTAGAGAPKATWGNPFAAHPQIRFLLPSPEAELPSIQTQSGALTYAASQSTGFWATA